MVQTMQTLDFLDSHNLKRAWNYVKRLLLCIHYNEPRGVLNHRLFIQQSVQDNNEESTKPRITSPF